MIIDTKTLYADLAENLHKGDLIGFTYDGETFEGVLLHDPAVSVTDDDFVSLTLSNEGDAGDAREVVVPWDYDVNVLGGDYDGIEID
jgi:hypothetical protein